MAKAKRKMAKRKAAKSRSAKAKSRRSKKAAPRRQADKSIHAVRFPNESKSYRTARNRLLEAEIGLRREVERVAALRRKLPLGGEIPLDYEFEEMDGDGATRRVRLSELFDDKDTLVIYSYMYSPSMESPCPSCTSILDALDGSDIHINQRVSLAVVAKSPIGRIEDFAQRRGWTELRLLSSEGNTYNHDYQGENDEGSQRPALNVFVRRDGKVHHMFCTELMFAPTDKGQNPRHVDMIWPLWNMFDFTPDGRGGTWQPKLSYG
jgi:predicted dithiol-disulfide oxidoreductase (DUF899 family)